jgi:hypothetical protein
MVRPRADVGDSEGAQRLRETLRQAALFWFSGLGRTPRDVLIRACRYTGETREKTLQRRFPAYIAKPPLDDQAIFHTVMDGYFRRGGIVTATNRGRVIIGTPWPPASDPHQKRLLLKQLKTSEKRRELAAVRCAKVVERQTVTRSPR